MYSALGADVSVWMATTFVFFITLLPNKVLATAIPPLHQDNEKIIPSQSASTEILKATNTAKTGQKQLVVQLPAAHSPVFVTTVI